MVMQHLTMGGMVKEEMVTEETVTGGDGEEEWLVLIGAINLLIVVLFHPNLLKTFNNMTCPIRY